MLWRLLPLAHPSHWLLVLRVLFPFTSRPLPVDFLSFSFPSLFLSLLFSFPSLFLSLPFPFASFFSSPPFPFAFTSFPPCFCCPFPFLSSPFRAAFGPVSFRPASLRLALANTADESGDIHAPSPHHTLPHSDWRGGERNARNQHGVTVNQRGVTVNQRGVTVNQRGVTVNQRGAIVHQCGVSVNQRSVTVNSAA